MRAIDSHIHFWKYDKNQKPTVGFGGKLMFQDHLPEQIVLSLQRNEVDSVMAVVSAPSELETHFLLEMAKTHLLIRGIIGWLDLSSADFTQRFEYFSRYSSIRSLSMTIDEKIATAFNSGRLHKHLALIQQTGWNLDIDCSAENRELLYRIIENFPDHSFILGNFGSPKMTKPDGFQEWATYVDELAKMQHCSLKLCGLFTQTSWKKWSPALFYPYLDKAVAAFGSSRLLFASDWPVLLLSGSYLQWKSLLEKYFQEFSDEIQEQIFAGNARRLYQI